MEPKYKKNNLNLFSLQPLIMLYTLTLTEGIDVNLKCSKLICFTASLLNSY